MTYSTWAHRAQGGHQVDDDRLWLDVPFAQNDEAKRAGARWDQQTRRWYAPPGYAQHLVRWQPLPDLLPGEDRCFGAGLYVDLVPVSCWFTNVRSCVAPRDWDRLRHMVYRRASHRCEACGAAKNASGVRLEAHERWEYRLQGTRPVQTLRRLVCLCAACHEVTHYGLASLRGRGEHALRHLMTVNGWHPHQACAHVDEAERVWRLRSQIDWMLDLTLLTAAGVSVSAPPGAAQRRAAAIARLNDVRTPHDERPLPATGT